MSKTEVEDLRRNERQQNSNSKYDNLNNNELEFKKKNPSYSDNNQINKKEDINSHSSYEEKYRNSYSRNHHLRHNSRSHSRSRSYSRRKNSSKFRY